MGSSLYAEAEQTAGLIPCDIGGAQPVVQQLVAYGALRGEVLDPGTGDGHHAIRYAPREYSTTTIDLSPTAIKRAKRNAERAGAQVDYEVAGAGKLDGFEGRFDTVVDSSFYHLFIDDEVASGGDSFQGGCSQTVFRDEGRIAAMDAAGIDVQILSCAPGPGTVEPPLAVELATQANDTVAAAVAKHPDRLLGFATLPMSDSTAAAGKLERAAGELGFVGALINGHVNGRYLDDTFFWPVFESAETLVCVLSPAANQ